MADEIIETNPTPDQGDDQTTDFQSRLQSQSAILGKVVNQSNNFAKEIAEMKALVSTLVESKTKEETEPAPTKKEKVKIPADEGQLSFNAMAERLAILEAKEQKKAQAAKRSILGRSLERHGVDPVASDKVAKLLEVDLGDLISVDDSGPEIAVNVRYGEESIPVEKFAQMWLESDEGSIFKTQSKKSPTPKVQGITPQKSTGGSLDMIEFAKNVANQFTPGVKTEEARKNAGSFKLKE